MRNRVEGQGLALQAIAGTYVVLLAWDIEDEALKEGLLGFALKRTDLADDESRWLKSMKVFPGAATTLGMSALTKNQPIQSFQWGDYSAKAGHAYTYKLVPLYGQPESLTEGNPLEVTITTESEEGETHSVFFNRGSVATQEYARRFNNIKPSEDASGEAYRWLSRGLVESIIGFIERATGEGYGLRGAFYQFQWPDVLAELRHARDRGADVRILYDAIPSADNNPVAANKKQIADSGIEDICQGFTDGTLMHNKFLVLTKDGTPVSVLTGSTNMTENGLYGHLNCIHVVEDGDVAADYLSLWEALQSDPGTSILKDWTGVRTALTADIDGDPVTCVFSPLSTLSTLETYAELAGQAEQGLFMTFAFGMNKLFQPVYRQDDDVLRFALMEKPGLPNAMEQGKQDIAEIRSLDNVMVAIGNHIKTNSFDAWLAELDAVSGNTHVHWVHTKFMLVDPLGAAPVVVTGSANFSDASTTKNQENMLVIRGDTRVADIYLGEFMRSFAHYAYREAVARHKKDGAKAEPWTPQYLATDNSWLEDYFKEGSARYLKRRYFVS